MSALKLRLGRAQTFRDVSVLWRLDSFGIRRQQLYPQGARGSLAFIPLGLTESVSSRPLKTISSSLASLDPVLRCLERDPERSADTGGRRARCDERRRTASCEAPLLFLRYNRLVFLAVSRYCLTALGSPPTSISVFLPALSVRATTYSYTLYSRSYVSRSSCWTCLSWDLCVQSRSREL